MGFFSRRRTHDDFSDEIQSHIALETDRLIADGMNADDARAAAERAFGNVTIVKERFYETSRWMWLEQLWQDLRYGWRSMRRSPSFMAASWIGSLLGAMALALSVSGLYGVLTYALSQRQRELGIRMALGATASTVVGLVVRQSTRLAGIGAVIGIIVALGAFKVLVSAIRLQAISLLDFGAFAAGLAVVMAATALA